MYGYYLLGNGQADEAVYVFKANIKKYPDSWNVYDSLAEVYKTKGEKVLATSYYETALAKVPYEAQKKRIREELSKLK